MANNGTNQNISPLEWGFFSFIVILLIVCVVCNGIIVTVFVVHKSIRNNTNMFVLSLACADLIIGVVSTPLWIAHSSPDHDIHFYLIGNVDIFCASASIYNCALLSIERALKIRFPYWYTNNVTAFRIKLVIFCGWIAAVLVGSLSFLRGKNATNLNYIIFISISSYILPVLAIFVSYISIFFVAHKHAKNIRRQNRQIDYIMTCTTVSEAKTAWRLSVFIIVFVICWTTFFLKIWWFMFFKDSGVHVKVLFEVIANALQNINAAINPFLYAIFNPSFRKGIVTLYRRKSKDGHKTETSRRIELSTAQTNVNNSPSLNRAAPSHCSPQIQRRDLFIYKKLLTSEHTERRGINNENIRNSNSYYYETSL